MNKYRYKKETSLMNIYQNKQALKNYIREYE